MRTHKFSTNFLEWCCQMLHSDLWSYLSLFIFQRLMHWICSMLTRCCVVMNIQCFRKAASAGALQKSSLVCHLLACVLHAAVAGGKILAVDLIGWDMKTPKTGNVKWWRSSLLWKWEQSWQWCHSCYWVGFKVQALHDSINTLRAAKLGKDMGVAGWVRLGHEGSECRQ